MINITVKYLTSCHMPDIKPMFDIGKSLSYILSNAKMSVGDNRLNGDVLPVFQVLNATLKTFQFHGIGTRTLVFLKIKL